MRLTFPHALRAADVISGVAFLLSLFTPDRACEFTPVPAWERDQTIVGRELFALARAQEAVRDAHGRFAADASELAGARLPRGVCVAVLEATRTAYRMRLDVPGDPVGEPAHPGRTCALWGSRDPARPDAVLPFRIDCRAPAAARPTADPGGDGSISLRRRSIAAADAVLHVSLAAHRHHEGCRSVACPFGPAAALGC